MVMQVLPVCTPEPVFRQPRLTYVLRQAAGLLLAAEAVPGCWMLDVDDLRYSAAEHATALML